MATRPPERGGAPQSELEAAQTRIEAESFLSALIRGTPWAAEEAWNRYAQMIYGLLRRGLGPDGDVDDLVQDVFLHLFRRVKTLRDATALRSFVFSIAVHVMRAQLRRRRIRRWVRLSDSGELPEVSQPPLDAEAREALRRVYALLDRLGSVDRTIFVLRQSEELGLQEIANAVDISISTVKRRLTRASSRMARQIQADPLLSTYVSSGGLFAVDREGRDG
jgi:RNA polymerase sigma-70 factor, ECF subfamily